MQTTISQKEYRRLHQLVSTAHRDFNKNLIARARYKLNNPATCEDIVQTTFLKTWMYLLRGGKIETMRAFLHHVLNGLIIDEYRKRSISSLDSLMERGFVPCGEVEDRTYDIMEAQELVALIDKISPKYKKILTMRYLEELSLDEMATSTGHTKNALAVQVHRGLQELKKLHAVSSQRRIMR